MLLSQSKTSRILQVIIKVSMNLALFLVPLFGSSGLSSRGFSRHSFMISHLPWYPVVHMDSLVDGYVRCRNIL